MLGIPRKQSFHGKPRSIPELSACPLKGLLSPFQRSSPSLLEPGPTTRDDSRTKHSSLRSKPCLLSFPKT